MEPRTAARAASARRDPESAAWIDTLSGGGTAREEAARRLHALLLRAARFQLARRAPWSLLRGESLDEVATEAADEALIVILAHLEDFRGASRFTTWACKFVIFEVSTALRRRLWKGREVPLDDEWSPLDSGSARPQETLEDREWLRSLRAAIGDLSERQRLVFVAVALNGAPIDVVAERLGTSRGSVYKTLHDARRNLRAQLALDGVSGSSDTRRGRSSAGR